MLRTGHFYNTVRFFFSKSLAICSAINSRLLGYLETRSMSIKRETFGISQEIVV